MNKNFKLLKSPTKNPPSLSPIPSTYLLSPMLSTRLDYVFTSTGCPATLWQAAIPLRMHNLCKREPGVAGGCLSLPYSFSLTFYLSPPTVRFFLCVNMSPVSHLTDTCPAGSNGRTLLGALDIQTLSACSCCAVH